MDQKNIDIKDNLILIEKINRVKNSAKKKIPITTEKFWFYEACKFCSCCVNRDSKYIAKNTLRIIKKNIEISEIIKKHFELEFLKNLLLKEDEKNLLPYQFKYLNMSNMSSTKKYLDFLSMKDFYVKKSKDETDEETKKKK